MTNKCFPCQTFFLVQLEELLYLIHLLFLQYQLISFSSAFAEFDIFIIIHIYNIACQLQFLYIFSNLSLALLKMYIIIDLKLL